MKLTAIAREDLEAKGLILKNKIELKCKEQQFRTFMRV